MPQQFYPPDQPIYDPRSGQSYDPRYLAALQGTLAWSGFAPTQPASLLQVLQALAQWMGMALPGAGTIRAGSLGRENIQSLVGLLGNQGYRGVRGGVGQSLEQVLGGYPNLRSLDVAGGSPSSWYRSPITGRAMPWTQDMEREAILDMIGDYFAFGSRQ